MPTDLFNDLLFPRGLAPILAQDMARHRAPQIATLTFSLFFQGSYVFGNQVELVHIDDDAPFLSSSHR